MASDVVDSLEQLAQAKMDAAEDVDALRAWYLAQPHDAQERLRVIFSALLPGLGAHAALTCHQAAALLDLSMEELAHLVSRGELSALSSQEPLFFSPAQLRAYLKECAEREDAMNEMHAFGEELLSLGLHE